jgi:hypothetical protein
MHAIYRGTNLKAQVSQKLALGAGSDLGRAASRRFGRIEPGILKSRGNLMCDGQEEVVCSVIEPSWCAAGQAYELKDSLGCFQ